MSAHCVLCFLFSMPPVFHTAGQQLDFSCLTELVRMWPYISLSTDTVLNAGVVSMEFDITVTTYVNMRYFHFMSEII